MVENDAYRNLAARHGFPDSERYRNVLTFLMTPQQAAIAVELPGAPEELSAKLGLDVAVVKQELDRLFRKGVVFPRNFETLENCRFARSTMQLHDASLSSLRLNPARHRRVFQLWDDFAHNEWYPRLVGDWEKAPAPTTRIVPAYQAVKDVPGLLPHEKVPELFKAAKLIALVSCTCRKRAEAVGKKCQFAHDAVCLQFNRGAEYALSRGSGTRLSVEEALDVARECEEDGLVHTWANTTSMTSGVMCNCCSDCCEVIYPLLHHKVPVTKQYSKSRFEAQVDSGLCNGCQVCVDRCPFGAIEMVKVEGQKKLKARVDPEACMGCGVCVLGCKADALTMKAVRPPEHIPQAA